MPLQPDGQQLPVSPRVGVLGGQPVDLRTEDLGGRWRHDLELGSSHFQYLRYIPIRVFIGKYILRLRSRSISTASKPASLHVPMCPIGRMLRQLFPLYSKAHDFEGSARLMGPRLVGAQILDLLGRLVFQLAGLVSGLATQIRSLLPGPHVDGLLGRLEFGSRFQSLSG